MADNGREKGAVPSAGGARKPPRKAPRAPSGKSPRRPRREGSSKPRTVRFRKWFRHYLNGKIYWAEDYGHEAWPFGS